jgi:hypothetical protein
MMHRPPYVPKLHSSQILTSVSGRTYESHTGLVKPKKKRETPDMAVPFSRQHTTEALETQNEEKSG